MQSLVDKITFVAKQFTEFRTSKNSEMAISLSELDYLSVLLAVYLSFLV